MFAASSYRLLMILGMSVAICRGSFGAEPSAQPGNTTASGTVEAMLNAANTGNFDRARKLETDRWTEEQKYWQERPVGDGYVGSWKNLTRGGTIAKIEIQSEEAKGDVTFARTLLHFPQSPENKPLTNFIKFKAVKINGEWQCDGF